MTIGRLVATYVTMRATMLSSKPACWNRTYSGIATAIGGRIRWEMSQNAMSLLASEWVNRRPIVWARIAKTAIADAITIAGGAPRAIPMNASAMLPIARPMRPIFGRYV